MSQHTNNYLRRFRERCDSVVCQGPGGLPQSCLRQKCRRASYLAGLLVLALTAHPIRAREMSPEPLKGFNVDVATKLNAQQQSPALVPKRSITISDAVSIFLQQNLELVAARYDIDTAEAEKLTARLRRDPQFSVSCEELHL